MNYGLKSDKADNAVSEAEALEEALQLDDLSEEQAIAARKGMHLMLLIKHSALGDLLRDEDLQIDADTAGDPTANLSGKADQD